MLLRSAEWCTLQTRVEAMLAGPTDEEQRLDTERCSPMRWDGMGVGFRTIVDGTALIDFSEDSQPLNNMTADGTIPHRPAGKPDDTYQHKKGNRRQPAEAESRNGRYWDRSLAPAGQCHSKSAAEEPPWRLNGPSGAGQASARAHTQETRP